jgi:hypothetical protein
LYEGGPRFCGKPAVSGRFDPNYAGNLLSVLILSRQRYVPYWGNAAGENWAKAALEFPAKNAKHAKSEAETRVRDQPGFTRQVTDSR